jgi:pimeloyl-ACP methyl ester carboxylesterase
MSELPDRLGSIGPTSQNPPVAAAEAFDSRRAWSLACACAAAYRGSAAEIVEPGFASVELFNASAACGYVAQCEKDVILALRGTDSPSDDGNRCLLQWLTHLDFKQIDGYNGRVHKGFATTADRLWEPVHRQVRAALVPGSRLWVTGHSMGGALATLIAARLMQESIPVAAVYTFGSPRVGDAAFASAYQPTLHRIENGNDIVCHLPPPPAVIRAIRPLLERLTASRLSWSIPADVSYEDCGKMTFIDWDGKVRAELPEGERPTLASVRLMRFGRMIFIAAERGSLLDDHRITKYVEKLTPAVPPTLLPSQSPADG